MRQAKRTKRAKSAKSVRRASSNPSSQRGKIAFLAALLTAALTVLAFWLSTDMRFLMPGPLASAHVAIENCSDCHTDSGKGKLTWIQGLASADPLSDSKACLSCHQMPNTALNPHGTSKAELKQRTDRLVKVAAQITAPQSAHAQRAAFPTDEMIAGGLNCASCHQEHMGAEFDIKKVADAQCQACHVVQFDSFDGQHPAFSNYPFSRRTRIIYDHESHFNKHFPEVAKKNPEKRRPATCKTCHDSSGDRRVMSVTSFDNTCATCHLDQIKGKERVSGPKGVAFLSLPGLDVETLRQKKAEIGEWPEDSEASLTPFMKAMISRKPAGRALMKTIESLDLQDLTKANDAQIKAVTSLVWEIKGVFYKLINGKSSDVLADLGAAGKSRLSPTLIADLTASMPRDVVIRAYQQWLPKLATEIAQREGRADQPPPSWAVSTVSQSSEPEAAPAAPAEPANEQPAPDNANASTPEEQPEVASVSEEPSEPEQEPEQDSPSEGSDGAQKSAENTITENPQDCVFSIFGQCLVNQQANPKPSQLGRIGNLGGKALAAKERPSAAPRSAIADTLNNARQTATKQVIAQATAPKQPQAGAARRDDKLLSPTKEELRALGARAKEIGNPGAPVNIAPSAPPAQAKQNNPAPAGQAPRAANAPTRSNEPAPDEVDAETWAEYGGWYQQDFAVFYRPKGHKDKFIYSWLVLTAAQAVPGANSPAADVFGFFTSKDAQGSCTKCHSVDNVGAKGRKVNFAPASVKTKKGKFTSFVHEPHFSIMGDSGCLTCHKLEKSRPYLKSFEQGDPLKFVSNFSEVKINLCRDCHTSEKSRQDCTLCHNYHVNGVVTPTINTKIPVQ